MLIPAGTFWLKAKQLLKPQYVLVYSKGLARIQLHEKYFIHKDDHDPGTEVKRRI